MSVKGIDEIKVELAEMSAKTLRSPKRPLDESNRAEMTAGCWAKSTLVFPGVKETHEWSLGILIKIPLDKDDVTWKRMETALLQLPHDEVS